MMRFLAELKRRKVIQTAVLYAVASWGLLQVAELLLDMLEVPPWGLKPVFAFLLLGFPLALLLSWMNRITPEGLRREDAATALPLGLPRRPTHLRRRMGPPPPSQCRRPRHPRRLARNARSPCCKPERRQGQRILRGRPVRGAFEPAVTTARAARRGAHLVVLIQAPRGRSRAQRHLRRPGRGASAVAGELALSLFGSGAPKARPTDPRAYSLYLQGRHFFSLSSASGFEQAIPPLEGALAIAPDFAPIWAMHGAPYWGEANNALIPYEEGTRRARAASERALALGHEQAEPMSLLGLLDVIELREVALGGASDARSSSSRTTSAFVTGVERCADAWTDR